MLALAQDGGVIVTRWQGLIQALRLDIVGCLFDWQPLCFVPEGRARGLVEILVGRDRQDEDAFVEQLA